MVKLTISLSDEKHERLRQLAERRKISMNKLMAELSTIVLVESDAETRFRTRVARGSWKKAGPAARGLHYPPVSWSVGGVRSWRKRSASLRKNSSGSSLRIFSRRGCLNDTGVSLKQ